MLDEQTIAVLNSMKLFGMAQSLPQRLADPKQAELSHSEFAALLTQDEKMHRDNRRLTRLLKNAKLKQQAEEKHTPVSVHFVAFDVDAKVFDSVKKLGATVFGASDEKQLNTQLEYILQRKILLEEEEPVKKK